MAAANILLDESSPYRSRRVVVERGPGATAAYLLNAQGRIRVPVWLANHEPAPATGDPASLYQGEAPLMPAAHTKHPQGRPPVEAARIRAVWFEEGDGVTLLEDGEILAVIPGWAEADRGLPGYARDAVGHTPYAWALDTAPEQLRSRMFHAQAYWRWRSDPEAWRSVQRAVFNHLNRTVGPSGHYWDISDGYPPLLRVSERPPTEQRPYTVLSTVGMCGQRMPTVERYLADPSPYARVELALATTGEPHLAARIFRWIGTFPWRAVTWFGPGHSVKWLDNPEDTALRGEYSAVLLVADPTPLGDGQYPPPATFGLTFHGDPVTWLWIVPLTRSQRLFAKENDAATVLDKLAAEGRSWILG